MPLATKLWVPAISTSYTSSGGSFSIFTTRSHRTSVDTPRGSFFFLLPPSRLSPPPRAPPRGGGCVPGGGGSRGGAPPPPPRFLCLACILLCNRDYHSFTH